MVQRTVVAMAWFKREDWPRFLTVIADRHRMPDDYDAWLKKITQQVSQLETSGQVVRRVNVDLDQLITWAGERKIEIDSNARARFAAEQAMRSIDG